MFLRRWCCLKQMQTCRYAAPPLVPEDRQIMAEQPHDEPGPHGSSAGSGSAGSSMLSGRKRPAGQSLTARANKMSGGHCICSLCREQACVWTRTHTMEG